MKNQKIRKINIRSFNRGMYEQVQDLPLAVYNKRTGKVLFVVISYQKGKELYAELRTNDTV